MKKRLLSLLLVLVVVFSFSLSAFATDTGIDIIDDPLSYYFENQMLGVQKGTGVTLVCPKCDYKVVYTGGTLVTCPYDGEALVLADLAGVHAEKVPSGIGRKDLPGYIDDSGTAHVSKEGKLKFVAHPCWLDVGEQESNKFTLTDPYKPYRVEEEDEDYGLYVYDWLGYNNGISHFSHYTQPLSDDMGYGNFDFYWIIDSGFVPGTYYVAADQPTVKNYYSKYGAEPQLLKTKEWTLQGSDDGKTWDDLDTQKDQNLSDLEEHKYPLTLRKAYKYYRLNMSNYASSMCSLSHFNLLGYDAKDVVTPTPAPTDPPSPSPAPDPGTDPTPVPTPGGGTVPAPGGDSNISGGDDEGLFGWIWDLLKDIVKSILKAIFKIIANILGFLIWIVERVGLLLPFLPGPAVAALGAGVVLVFVIRIIRFIRG